MSSTRTGLPGREAPRRMVDVTQAVPMVVAAAGGHCAAAAPQLHLQRRPRPPRAAPAAAPAPAPAPHRQPAHCSPATPAAALRLRRSRRTSVPRWRWTRRRYEKTLEELLAAGTDRRIAEGKAKRAAMIAARKKAGEG